MKYHQLALEQRYMIYTLKQEGYSQRRIAEVVGAHKSTISRELRRNIRQRGYRPDMAHCLAMARRRMPRKPAVLTPRVRHQLSYYIRKKWSPEQISGWLDRHGKLSISHETIYKFIHEDRAKGGCLYKHLRRQKKYRRHRFGLNRAPILDRVSIDERPAIVDQKSRIGDWEIDTIFSSEGRSALVTMVERVSKYCVLGKVAAKNARSVAQCIVPLLAPLKKKVLTITADNGPEFATHKLIARKLKIDFYFAHPYKAWERGLNENTNGIIRQYLPKGISFKDLTREQVFDIMKELNHRPRKTLEFRTPIEIFYGSVALAG